MLFNSFEFLIFLPIVFIVYWFILNEKLKLQNLFLVAVSYVFYGWWDWRFLGLIIFSSLVDFYVAQSIAKTEMLKQKKRLLFISLFVNIGLLGVFKYFNFFSESFSATFNSIGIQFDSLTINVILPVGISFYTFQTLSYTIDVYRNKLKPQKDIISFFAFVSFFPQLVAGPIERATNLLPQFYKKRKFNYQQAVDGMRQILWGFFKKIVIADNAAIYVNDIFSNSDSLPGSILLLGAVLFAFQIYGDFSGYSDIAIGVSRLFGFNLMQNFAFPYFSRDIAEFWRRWHISLSTWFRDYVYIPLGGSKGGTWMKIRNTFIIFMVSGFWHGANWTFIIWGLLNALYFIPLMLMGKNRKNLDIAGQGKLFPKPKELFQILITFSLTVLAWVFFRSENVSQALSILNEIFSKSLFLIPNIANALPVEIINRLLLLFYIIIFIFVEWLQREKQHGLEDIFIKTNSLHKGLRNISYIVIALIIMLNISNEAASFIYFQF